MYWIIEGRALVFVETPDGNIIRIANLKNGDYFGEMGILQHLANQRGKLEKPLRGASVKAVTNLYLAVLSLHDFEFITKIYDEIRDMIKNMA
jgi:CRP-like cAMP-binding protein